MPFDGIVTASVVQELNHQIQNGKIEKVYQPENNEIVLLIHRGKEKHRVFLTVDSAHPRVHLVPENPPNPPQPPAFCMLLRKHLQGGRISQVVQKSTERIIEFWIDSFNELGYPITKKLIAEIMGKHSNITLVDGETGKIIDSIKRISVDVNRYRQILPGMTYVYPPEQNKIPFSSLTYQEFLQILSDSSGTLEKGMVSGIMGLSPFFADALCASAGLSHELLCRETDEEIKNRLFLPIHTTQKKVEKEEFSPAVWLDENDLPLDFHCFDHPTYTKDCKKITFESISQAADYFYGKKASSNRIKQKSTDLSKFLNSALEKLLLKKARLSEEILQAEKSDHYKLQGELLLANLYRITPGMNTITVQNYYTQEDMEIQLDSRLSPSDNSQRYYKKYNKAKTALKEKTVQLTETEKEIRYLESILHSLEESEDFTDVEAIRQELIDGGYLKRRQKNNIKKAAELLPPHSYRSSDGFRILAGRNNKQNDQLTLKMAGSMDLWFHTKDIPGTHVILFTEGKEPSEKALAEAASVAAYHSKGRQSENVPVDYTKVKYVKKPSGAKPGMVIFDHNKTLYVSPAIPTNLEK